MLKKIARLILGNEPVARFGQWLNRHRPLVLLYHGVTDRKDFTGLENYHSKHIYIDDFRQQIRWLKRNFSIVPLATIEQSLAPTEPLCAITFDDGYENNYRCAWPILKEGRVTATIFLTGNFIERKIPLWPDRLEFTLNHGLGSNLATALALRQKLKFCPPKERERRLSDLEHRTGVALSLKEPSNYSPLTWSEIAELSRYGITFGAHTLSHPILSQLTLEDQTQEILGSKKLIEGRLGTCPHFAYPNGQPGDWDQATLRILTGSGWSAAWTTLPRRIRPGRDHPLLSPRLTIAAYHDFNRFRALVAGLVPR